MGCFPTDFGVRQKVIRFEAVETGLRANGPDVLAVVVIDIKDGILLGVEAQYRYVIHTNTFQGLEGQELENDFGQSGSASFQRAEVVFSLGDARKQSIGILFQGGGETGKGVSPVKRLTIMGQKSGQHDFREKSGNGIDQNNACQGLLQAMNGGEKGDSPIT